MCFQKIKLKMKEKEEMSKEKDRLNKAFYFFVAVFVIRMFLGDSDFNNPSQAGIILDFLFPISGVLLVIMFLKHKKSEKKN